VLPLLAFSVFINYIDRGNLSIAAPMPKGELGMSASQLGVLLSSLFWTYSLFLILSGRLVDRVSASWVINVITLFDHGISPSHFAAESYLSCACCAKDRHRIAILPLSVCTSIRVPPPLTF
jgi:MFS family permease